MSFLIKKTAAELIIMFLYTQTNTLNSRILICVFPVSSVHDKHTWTSCVSEEWQEVTWVQYTELNLINAVNGVMNHNNSTIEYTHTHTHPHTHARAQVHAYSRTRTPLLFWKGLAGNRRIGFVTWRKNWLVWIIFFGVKNLKKNEFEEKKRRQKKTFGYISLTVS